MQTEEATVMQETQRRRPCKKEEETGRAEMRREKTPLDSKVRKREKNNERVWREKGPTYEFQRPSDYRMDIS